METMATSGEETITGGGCGGGEFMLFGVRVVVDSMRKSVSLNNLSQYEPPNASSSNHNDGEAVPAVAAASGYASADEDVPQRSNNRERKRGIPWSEEEHTRFLVGLKKLGKGDWRGIAKNFVLTRTPTQVASHAQKYYIRRSNVSRRRRRSSLFDITTDSVVAVPANDQQTNQDEASQSLPLVSTQTTSYPLSIAPAVDYKHFLPTQVAPVPQKPTRTSSPADLDIDMNSGINPSLSLNLSLSSSSDQDGSSRQEHSGFHIMSNSRASSIIGIA
ncbi:Transcription factor MYB1R1-like protein [Drosera capensis]